MVGVNSKKGCFGRKTQFFWESEDFAGNHETYEIFREVQSNKVQFLGSLRFLGEYRPKFCDDVPYFREDFY